MTRPSLTPIPTDGAQPAVPPSVTPPAAGPEAVDTLARTLWGEARGESRAGIEAVAAVVVNRVRIAMGRRSPHWWGRTVEGVCRAPRQFSCWNHDDPNLPKLMAVTENDPVFALCIEIARKAVAGTLVDRTSGATHYHAASIEPYWARGREPTTRIGRHVFHRLAE